jgi:hypothetical protein
VALARIVLHDFAHMALLQQPGIHYVHGATPMHTAMLPERATDVHMLCWHVLHACKCSWLAVCLLLEALYCCSRITWLLPEAEAARGRLCAAQSFIMVWYS